MHPWHRSYKAIRQISPWATVGHLWARKEVITTLATLTAPAFAALLDFTHSWTPLTPLCNLSKQASPTSRILPR